MSRVGFAPWALVVPLVMPLGCDDTTGSGGAGSMGTTTSTSKTSASIASTGTASMNACPAWADAENAVGVTLGCTPDPNHIQGCEGPRSAAGTCTDELDAFFACAAMHADTTNCSCSTMTDYVVCDVAPCQAASDAYYQCAAGL